jgi:hypothetical protein
MNTENGILREGDFFVKANIDVGFCLIVDDI